MIVSEVRVSDGPIIKPDIVLNEVDVPKALNRIANIADAENWDPWEIREAVRQVLVNGAFYEQRPSFYMSRYRKGIVIAAGENSGVKFGEVVLFSYRLSAFYSSGWRDCPLIDSSNILFVDSSGAAVKLDSRQPIYIVPKDAALGRFRFDGMLERDAA